MNKKVLIAGYYGFKNTGDEAILGAMLSSFRAIRPDLEFIVVSGSPAETAAEHRVQSILWTDLPAILEIARHCDLIILGGGGLFAEYWRTYPETLLTSHHGNNSFYSGFPLLAKLNDKPCMIYGVGVGPLLSESAKNLFRMAFEIADVATVRDDESRKLAESLGADCSAIRVSVDPAFSLPIDKPKAIEALGKIRAEQDRPIVAVSLRNWDVGVSPEKWQQLIAAAFDQFIDAHSVSMAFVPFQVLPMEDVTNDLAVAEQVMARMRHSDAVTVVQDRCSFHEIAGIFAQCDLVVGMRLHSIIFGLKEAVPSVGIAYDPKVKNIMIRLDMQQYAVDLVSLTSRELCQTMSRAWDHRTQIRAELEDKIKELKSLAAEDVMLAIRLLDKVYPTELKLTATTHIRQFALKQALLLAEKETIIQSFSESINTLSGEKLENEERLSVLSAQLAEKQAATQSLSAQLADKETSMTSLAVQLAEKETSMISLAAQLAEKETSMTSLAAQLAEKETAIKSLTVQLGENQSSISFLSERLAEAERTLRAFSAQLAAKEAELRKITSSLGWRLLSRYGRIKYRYLLPIYRLLRLGPKQTASLAGEQSTQHGVNSGTD